MRIDDACDHIQMRDGSGYVGAVEEDTLLVKVSFSDTPLQIKRDKMIWVIFHNDYGYATDRITMKDATEVQGMVQNPTVKFTSDATGDVQIPTKNILAIQFLGLIDG